MRQIISREQRLYAPLDQDILFVLGERRMPLSVYESPVMSAYRQFRQMKNKKKEEGVKESDGYYVVHKKRIFGDVVRASIGKNEADGSGGGDATMEVDWTEVENEEEGELEGDGNTGGDTQREVVLLYGRGPVFQLEHEYSDRFEGFDD